LFNSCRREVISEFGSVPLVMMLRLGGVTSLSRATVISRREFYLFIFISV
jgi:hypothetical protein